ncbi:MAG: MMPL family transporter, partial [Aeromicrobium sp.]
ATHESRYDAMAIALRRTAEAVLTSAATVVLGVLTLILSLTPSTRALGVAAAIGIAVASAFVLIVLPALLVCFGRWVFWPRVPRATTTDAGTADALVERSLWFRVGTLVSRRPRAIIAGSLVVVAVAASGLLGISLGLDSAESFKDKPEAIAGAERIAESFPAGTSDPVQIVSRESGDTVLGIVDGHAGVESAAVTEQGNGVTLVEAVLEAAPGSDEAKSTVESLRSALDDLPQTYVTGTDATTIDAQDSLVRDLLLIIPIVVLLVTLTLGVLLRSVVAPVILVATVVATYAAALGASWWVFTGIFGYEGLDVNVPLIGFVFLVALGVDYNIFLVTRAREETAARGTRAGMLHALGATGGVITSAGILLAAVFTVLGLLPAVALAQIGVLICIGVLLDTLLIRTVLVPAIALVLGDRFWWPRRIEEGAVHE